MVRKEKCPVCKGNKYIKVTLSSGRSESRRCSNCGGSGYKVRLTPRECAKPWTATYCASSSWT